MAGNQFPHNSTSTNEIDALYDVVNKRITNILEVYKLLAQDIVYIQISFRKLDVKLLSDFRLDKSDVVIDNMTKRDIDTISSTSNIPVSTNESSLGTPLKVTFVDNLITSISVTRGGESFNLLDKIKAQSKLLPNNHKDKITTFDSSFKFYLTNINMKYYVLAIKYVDSNKVIKISYFLNGVVDKSVTDTLLSCNTVSRVHGNTEFLIDNGNVVYSKKDLMLRPVGKPKVTYMPGENPNIGVIDLETFKDIDDKVKVYAAGFMTNLVDRPTIYYLKNDLTSHDLIINLVNELFRSMYERTTFYCHNLGRYDIVYIINALHAYNDKCDSLEIQDTKYNMSFIHRDKDIISVTISKDIDTMSSHKKGNKKILGSRTAKLIIRDSMPLLNNSLSDLAKSYGVEIQKGIFPYKFATRANLFYVGNTPHKSYFNPSLTQSAYDNIVSSNWSFRDETHKYLESDLYSLYQVIRKANKQVFLDYDVNMTDNLTISGLALKIFRSKYYNNDIPLVNKTSMYRDIKEAYYGAITEVYKPYGEKLYYYDVNSLYPYVALQDMPGINCSKENFINTCDTEIDKSIKNLFGFYYCSVESPKDNYLGLLPFRSEGGLIFPLGTWKGWYFSEELKFAQENGYKIKVIKGYSFNRSKDVFKDFVKDVYSIKTNPKDSTQKQTAKSILNNLMGRFGIRLEKSVTKVMSGGSLDILSTRKAIISEKDLGILLPKYGFILF